MEEEVKEKKRKVFNSNNTLGVVIAVASVILIIASIAYAVFISNDSKENKVTIGTVNIEIENLSLKDSSNTEVTQISPGGINTINWTTNNIGTSAVLTRQTVEIYWESENSTKGIEYLKLYPTSVTDEQINADFEADASATTNELNITQITKQVDGKDIYGIRYQFIGNTLEGTTNQGVSDISSDDCSLKLVLSPKTSYLFQNEPISIKIIADAMQYTEESAEEWSNVEESEIANLELKLFSNSDNDNTNANTSKIRVDLEEDQEWQENEDEYGIEKYQKNISGVSKESEPAYVRVRCIPIVQYFDETANEGEGKWITAPISQDQISLKFNSDNWIKSGDYLYYKEILPGYATSESLNIEWTILEMPSELATKDIRTDVRVLLEYAQASNGVWKQVFGITQLPEGVKHE